MSALAGMALKAGSVGYAEVMLIQYNRKNGSNAALKWAALYGKKSQPSEALNQISMAEQQSR